MPRNSSMPVNHKGSNIEGGDGMTLGITVVCNWIQMMIYAILLMIFDGSENPGHHQLRLVVFSQYLQGFVHPRWCRISSINGMSTILIMKYYRSTMYIYIYVYMDFWCCSAGKPSWRHTLALPSAGWANWFWWFVGDRNSWVWRNIIPTSHDIFDWMNRWEMLAPFEGKYCV